MSARVASRPKFFIDRETPIPGFLVESVLEQFVDQIHETEVHEMCFPADTAHGWFNTVPDGRSMSAFVLAQASRYLEGPKPTATPNAKTLSDLSDDTNLAIESALRTEDIEHASARLKGFRQLHDDWDGEGASAPSEEVIDTAIAFLNRLQPWHPRPVSGLDSAGSPVIEFHDDETSFFGKVRFTSPDTVEMFAVDGSSRTEFLEGTLNSAQAAKFLSDQFQITLRP